MSVRVSSNIIRGDPWNVYNMRHHTHAFNIQYNTIRMYIWRIPGPQDPYNFYDALYNYYWITVYKAFTLNNKYI